MYPFVYQALSQRVVFGSGTTGQVGDELARMELTRALVLTTPQQEEIGRQMVTTLGARAAGLFAGAAMHTPIEVTDEALKQIEAVGADCVVSIGGGSTTGLGKAIALRTDLPQIVIPTSYAGSEATPILGETKNGAKTTQRSMKVLPEVIVYDVDLTMSLPAKMTVTSGLNAIAHSVEGLYTQDRNPIISTIAQQGIAALARALPVIHQRPDDAEARSDALYGAWACGTVLGAVGMALHHKICHVLGGSFELPHAETHSHTATRHSLQRARRGAGVGARCRYFSVRKRGIWPLVFRASSRCAHDACRVGHETTRSRPCGGGHDEQSLLEPAAACRGGVARSA